MATMGTAASLEVARLFHNALNSAIALSSVAHRDSAQVAWRHRKEGCAQAAALLHHVERLNGTDVDAFLAGCRLTDVRLPEFRLYCESWHRLVVELTATVADKVVDALEIDHEVKLWAALVIRVNPAPYWPELATALKELPPVAPVEKEIDAGLRREWLEIQRQATQRQATDDNRWSEPRSPKEWARVFGISTDTFRRYRTSTPPKIRCREVTSKSIRVHLDDLPRPK